MKKILIISILLLLVSHSLYSTPKILKIRVDGAITPATSSFIARGIEKSQKIDAEAVIIMLNTPGGLLESTREIVQNILESPIPVVVYVAPQGARAGSAGVFITLAANIAVMAPGTNIGAAHPVGMQGEADSSVMFDKVTNDAAAFVRSIAQRRNRNASWAEKSVRESISSTEKEALDSNVIDFIAPNLDSLLKAINNFKTTTSTGEKIINTTDIQIIELESNWKDELLKIISNPNVAYLLLMAGIYGIFFEIYNPGAIFPGVLGGISLILAAYSFQMLPVNWAGIALILLAVVMFLLEIKIVSHGLLSIGGVISLFLGSIMLFDDPTEYVNVSMSLIITVVILTTLFFLVIISLGIKAQYRKASLGSSALIDQTAIVISDIKPGKPGKVKVRGEIWRAVSDAEINSGYEVIIEKVESLTLFVKPK
ncbi:MAG: nodulation protein NfeD [Candidatus Kapabacteria bacterium]|nr:nodulation protein NfeD [Candidatus Kapabacteria bacterium]